MSYAIKYKLNEVQKEVLYFEIEAEKARKKGENKTKQRCAWLGSTRGTVSDLFLHNLKMHHIF